MPWVEPFVHQASDRHRRGAVGTSTRAVACALTNICFTKLKRFTFFFLKKKNDPGSDVFVFLGNKPVSRRSTSLTLQGDFCVSMIGRAALRCKKNATCAAQKTRRHARSPCSGGRRCGPRKRKTKKISKLQQVKLLRNGPTRLNRDVSEIGLRVLHSTATAHDRRNQLICCGAHRGKRQIRDNRSALQGTSAEEENAQKTNERARSWRVSCELPNK